MPNLIELTEVLKPEAFKSLSKGDTLGFQQADGSIDHYKIIRLNKTRRTCWVEKVTLYTKEEMEEVWEGERKK